MHWLTDPKARPQPFCCPHHSPAMVARAHLALQGEGFLIFCSLTSTSCGSSDCTQDRRGNGGWRRMLTGDAGSLVWGEPQQLPRTVGYAPPPPLGPLTRHEPTSAAQTLSLEVVVQPHSQTLPSQNVARYPTKLGFPGGASGKEPACQCRRRERLDTG